MSYPRCKSSRPERGAALVVAMLIFALVAALMVGLQRDFTLTLQRGTHQLFSEQAWAYLIGAEELAAVALQADSRADARAEVAADHLGEVWAQPATPYPLDAGGWMASVASKTTRWPTHCRNEANKRQDMTGKCGK